MNKQQLVDCIEHGREIEFRYNGKQYSITYSPEGTDDFISFCEFYKEPSDVKTVEELMRVTRDNVSVIDMLESLSDDNIWIY